MVLCLICRFVLGFFSSPRVDRNHEVKVDWISGAGDGSHGQNTHAFHQNGNVSSHGAGRHVDDAQTSSGLAKN